MKKKSRFVLGMIAGIVVLLIFLCVPTFHKSPGPPSKESLPKPEPAPPSPSWPDPGSTIGKGEAPPPPSDSLAAVDRILVRMPFGSIAFNTPRSMNLYSKALIQLLLDIKTPIEELKQYVKAEGEKAGERIRVSNRMAARLTGPNFAITAITQETQAVSGAEMTEWKWEIKPKNAGSQFLHLTLSAILNVEGADTPRTIRTFDKIIEVEVTWNQKVTGFIRKNWQWLWAAVLVPIAGWLWKKKKWRIKRNDNKNES
jgi:hypothetical protein